MQFNRIKVIKIVIRRQAFQKMTAGFTAACALAYKIQIQTQKQKAKCGCKSKCKIKPAGRRRVQEQKENGVFKIKYKCKCKDLRQPAFKSSYQQINLSTLLRQGFGGQANQPPMMKWLCRFAPRHDGKENSNSNSNSKGVLVSRASIPVEGGPAGVPAMEGLWRI